MSRALTIATVLALALAGRFAGSAAAQGAPTMPVPTGAVNEMAVLPFGPARIVTRNIFDVIVAPPVMPAGPFTSGEEEAPDRQTVIPPRFEWEGFDYDDEGNRHGWPSLRGDRYGGVVLGFVEKRKRFTYGLIVPYHRVSAKTSVRIQQTIPDPTTPMMIDASGDIEADIEAFGVGGFASYDVLSEKEAQPATVTAGAAAGWLMTRQDVRANYAVGYSSPATSGNDYQSRRDHDDRNTGVAGPFLNARKDLGVVTVGLAGLYLASVTDNSDSWVSHEVIYSPYVAAPVTDRVTVSVSGARVDILKDERGPSGFPSHYYMVTGQMAVGITPTVKAFAGARRMLGVEDYRSDSVFGGLEIVF
ncbi:MAG TPA: hypothetical protein PL033_05170 [Candidatus Brocadiia bacterium]|nr:hypothetical protein [Candidatus Brocadiia bacterium]